MTVRTNIARLVEGDRGDDRRSGRGRHHLDDRFGGEPQEGAGESRPDLQDRAPEGTDSGTAFSIDIADVDVGANIGSLQTDQAEADTKRYQAEAEKRRALAIAQEAERAAEAAKNRTSGHPCGADVPKAMADAFRQGNMGIMDYYRMQNVIADTAMRNTVADPEDNTPDS